MKFIHTADIHLDSPLDGLAAYRDAPVDLLRTATREAFAALVTEAVREQVDFMVIAGDLYDGSWRDFHTGIFFARQMGRLQAAGIPCFVLLGNHDAESEMTRQLELPSNVRRFSSTRAETFKIEALRVALHGRSFRHAATTENLAAGYPPAIEGWLNIGVLHTALEGHAAHRPYAPCTRGELAARGYQYWALGHVHEHAVEVVGRSTLAFPGNLQGRSIRETGPRGALLVEADGTDITRVSRLHTDVLRWHELVVDLAGAASMPEAVRRCGESLQALPAALGWACPLAVRVRLVGACAAHAELFGAGAHLRAELMAQAAAAGGDGLWIEKVKLQTEPAVRAEDTAAQGDALAELQQVLQAAAADPGLLKALDDELQAVVAKLERPVADALADVALLRAGRVAEIVERVRPSLLAQVLRQG